MKVNSIRHLNGIVITFKGNPSIYIRYDFDSWYQIVSNDHYEIRDHMLVNLLEKAYQEHEK